MADHQHHPLHLSEAREADSTDYRAVSALAVLGMVFGLLSPLALLGLLGGFFPMAGAVVSLTALRRIARRAPELVGRKAAIFGLALSVLFGALALSRSGVYAWVVDHQSRQVVLRWFDLLARQQPHKAMELMRPPSDRTPPDGDAWALYRQDEKNRNRLAMFVEDPLVRTLLALGNNALVRYQGTEHVSGRKGKEELVQIYSVTFDENGRTKTFFVEVDVDRCQQGQVESWIIIRATGGARPSWI